MKVFTCSENYSVPDTFFHKQIVWHNKDIVFNTKSLFYADWFGCGIIHLKDLFIKERFFLSIKDLSVRIETNKSKQNLLFDYTKLKKAIPKIGFNVFTKEETEPVYYTHSLETPYFKLGRVTLLISDVSSKPFDNLISFKHKFNKRFCLLGDNILQRNIDWSSVFKRNLTYTREHRLLKGVQF